MSEDLDHLAPEQREEVRLRPEERIRRIRLDRWISYSRAELVLARMRELLDHPPHDRMPCLLLYGATGMGKTKILRKFLRESPNTFDQRTGVTHMPIVSMQMPPEPEEKSFYEELLHALDSPVHHGHTASQMRRTARDLLTFVDARMLVIDELHSLLAGTHRQQQILLNTIRFLANDLKLPLVCAGTADAKRALMTDRQLADRFEAMELPPWRNDEDYRRLMASFVSMFPLKRKSDLLAPAVRRAILEHTEGVMVRMVRLVQALAIEAIRSGAECIDASSLELLSRLTPLLSMEEKSRAAYSR
jgi:replication-associated recombination protein RarA